MGYNLQATYLLQSDYYDIRHLNQLIISEVAFEFHPPFLPSNAENSSRKQSIAYNSNPPNKLRSFATQKRDRN